MWSKRTLFAGLVAALALSVVARAEEPAEERAVPNRAFDRFSLDTENVHGFWGELGALYEGKDISGGPDLDMVYSFLRLAYGQKKWEAGLTMPYESVNGTTVPSGLVFDDNGPGDLQLYGRYMALQTEIVDLGLGTQFSLPSGDRDNGLGTGEFGALPFGNAALKLGIGEVRGHVGYEVFTGSNGRGLAYNRLLWGAGIFATVGKYVALRNEFSGTRFDASGPGSQPKVVSYLPGVDIRIPIGDLDLLIRPTGLVGISDNAPDWGAGASIAIASKTTKVPAGASPYGGVVVE
jgi:hypothetical protein